MKERREPAQDQVVRRLLTEADLIAQEVQDHLLAVQVAVKEAAAHLLAAGREALRLAALLQGVAVHEASALRLQAVGEAALAAAALLLEAAPLRAQAVLEAVAVPAVREVQEAVAEAVAVLAKEETKG